MKKKIDQLLLSMPIWLRIKVLWYSHFNLKKSIELTKEHIRKNGKKTGWELLAQEE